MVLNGIDVVQSWIGRTAQSEQDSDLQPVAPVGDPDEQGCRCSGLVVEHIPGVSVDPCWNLRSFFRHNTHFHECQIQMGLSMIVVHSNMFLWLLSHVLYAWHDIDIQVCALCVNVGHDAVARGFEDTGVSGALSFPLFAPNTKAYKSKSTLPETRVVQHLKWQDDCPIVPFFGAAFSERVTSISGHVWEATFVRWRHHGNARGHDGQVQGQED